MPGYAGDAMNECLECGYVYLPADGAPAAGVSPGTPFEELPAAFACPACGSDRDRFVELESPPEGEGGAGDGRAAG